MGPNLLSPTKESLGVAMNCSAAPEATGRRSFQAFYFAPAVKRPIKESLMHTPKHPKQKKPFNPSLSKMLREYNTGHSWTQTSDVSYRPATSSQNNSSSLTLAKSQPVSARKLATECVLLFQQRLPSLDTALFTCLFSVLLCLHFIVVAAVARVWLTFSNN